MARTAKHATLWSARSNHSGNRSAGNANERGNERKGHTNPLTFCLSLGFFAGLIWGTLRGIAYWLKFTKLVPGVLADPFFKMSFLKSGWGYTLGIGSFIVFSILCTLIYYALFSRVGGPWMGVVYGFLWWAIIFGLVGPMMAFTPALTLIGWDTLFTELCIFLLWGTFIGYSIAFEFTDEASREPAGSAAGAT
ncbi:YqhR family membrane protein [Paenibacillus kobensis]|uniref:YqhR family membrane protein n=1 Tax=Paenibacillus kobensis TaxID=59841 RepID=UPI000FD88466|nr:YqhR family membrane protein [Paenibacillus kobensis]